MSIVDQFKRLRIDLVIVPDQPVDAKNFVAYSYEGNPLFGLNGIEFSIEPRHIILTVLDKDRFEKSAKNAGFVVPDGVKVQYRGYYKYPEDTKGLLG